MYLGDGLRPLDPGGSRALCQFINALVLAQGLHSVAYTGGLSNPLVAQEGASHRLSAEVIADFIASNYSAGRMVLVGAP